MTTEQMGQLTQASGVAFDRMFLQMMNEHHRGAAWWAPPSTQVVDRGQRPDPFPGATVNVSEVPGCCVGAVGVRV